MARIAIVGDGPGGLSAALFLARGGHEVAVYGMDKTAMHFAELNNYLGIPKILGSDFQELARRQARAAGAEIIAADVVEVSGSAGAFAVSSEAGDDAVQYLILSEGKAAPLAESMGIVGTDVDRDGRSSVDGVYVIGRSARPTRSQAIISAGDGAAAALDILAIESGDDVQDWDTPPKE